MRPATALSTISLTMLEGMAKPTPCEPPEREKIAVLMPTTLPAMSTSAPPELPGLMAASVWMKTCASECAYLGAGQRRDDAAGHGLADAERIADRQHLVAHLDRVGVLELQIGETAIAALDPQHRDVGLVVLLHDLGIELAPVGERDANLGRPADLDDMSVGDDDPLGGNDHAGPQRVLDALLRHAEALAEEAAEQRVVGEGRHECGHARAHVDVDDGGCSLLDDRREGVLRGLTRGRRLLALGRGRGDHEQPSPE